MSESTKTATNTKENGSTNKETNGLVVKEVDLFGDNVMAAQDKDGVIWAGVNYFCRGLGLNKNERDRQIKNIQSDEVLKRGCVKFDAGIFDSNNGTLALQVDYVPLWLAKISITPNMKANHPELVEKLIKYQLKAKDVLAAAFLPESVNNSSGNAYGQQKGSGQSYFKNIPNVLEYNNEPVITTAELAKHYGTSNQNVLNAFYQMCRKTPCFSYGNIRHVHRIYASN